MAGRRADADGGRLLPPGGGSWPSATAGPASRSQHTIQTNGTLLTDEWCELFARAPLPRGPQHRRPAGAPRRATGSTSGASPPSTKVLPGLRAAAAPRRGRQRAVHRARRQPGPPARGLPLLPRRPGPARTSSSSRSSSGTTTPDSRRATRSPSARSTRRRGGAFLSAVFDEWVVRDVGRVFVQMFDAALAAWLDLPPPMCIFQETCGDAVALEHNGDVYSCDHFVEPDHLLGNIGHTPPWSSWSTSPQQRRLRPGQGRHACRRTAGVARSASPATASAPRTASPSPPDGEPGLNYLCAGYLAFFTHVDGPMRLMADLLRSGRLRGRGAWGSSPRARRNDPCPCGSGRKSKLCHQR